MTTSDHRPSPAPAERAGPDAADAAPAGGPRTMATWRAFRARHLHDYTPGATALWLAIVGCGLLALVWALSRLLLAGAAPVLETTIAVALSALASRFALQLPRGASAHSAADIFIFGALLHAGPAAAVLAAGIEGWVGTRRTSKRLSSWLASPAAGMAAMAACAWVFETTRAALAAAGLAGGTAAFCALLAAALVPYLGTVLPLTAMMALKRAAPLRPGRWLADTAWMAAVYMGSAFVAGLVHLVSLHHGPTVLVASAAAVLGLVGLLRVSLARHEADRRQQEARVNDAEREARLSQQRFTAAFTHAAIGMAVVRPNDEILQVNAALCALLGVDADALLRRRFCDSLHPGDAALFRRRVQEVLTPAGQAFSMELRVDHGGGDELWASVHCSRYDDPAGQEQCLIYQVHDITSRHLAERQLQHIAHHDMLTDLANRHCFQERLALAVERTRENADERFAVMFMDLDRFKMVNDSFGHHAGNELLCTTAQRLRAGVRPGDLVARLGGDEFAVLLERLGSQAEVTVVVERILDAMRRPMTVHERELSVAVSIGVAHGDDVAVRRADGDSSGDAVTVLLRHADLALYRAKETGRAAAVTFMAGMHADELARRELEAELRRAVTSLAARRDFAPFALEYQPIVDLDTGAITAVEALLRWRRPDGETVAPSHFIPVAEETGLIVPLGRRVIDEACAQLARLDAAGVGRALRICVNLSRRQLDDAHLVPDIVASLARHAIAPERLVLELTESLVMRDPVTTRERLSQLKGIGVSIAIDDFGTGYSSLATIHDYPVDVLKVDRSFLARLEQRPNDEALLRAILELGQALSLRTVVEGIETPEQLALVRRLGARRGQGWHLGRPVPAAALMALLAATDADVVSTPPVATAA
jgi:diguanylate cyclase (GGDEF)-like protein/PAS domain S-box-containing protein